jgi:hypothetical protein
MAGLRQRAQPGFRLPVPREPAYAAKRTEARRERPATAYGEPEAGLGELMPILPTRTIALRKETFPLQNERRSGRAFDGAVVQLVQLVVERLQADPEFLGGAGLVAMIPLEPLEDGLHLQFAKADGLS